MKRRQHRFLLAWMVFVLAVASSPAVMAGEGTYTAGTPDEIALNVAFMYDEPCFHTSPISCPAWETLFKEGSKLLYDATEKQVRISKVRFYNNCPEASAKADIQIHNDTQGAYAHVDGLGRSGTFIRLSQTHKTVTTGTAAGNRGQFGLVHEMGHYVFALLDEYLDKTGANTADAYCIDQTGTTASIMDGGTTVDPANRRTEFCWSGNHRAGHTEQDKKRTINAVDYENTDCWTFMQAFVQDRWNAAFTLPTADPSSDVAGHVDPSFEYYSCGVRAVTCIDRSGSMIGDPITLAKLGASTFVNLTLSTDQLAVTSYADSATTNFAMATMTDANKTAAKAAINGIVATGNTNIGGGLQTSLNEITAAGAPVSNEVIILLSDGQHNTGTHPDSVIPALRARNVTVYTIGLGYVDASLMRSIATQTGGNYIYATSNAELQGHFQQILAEMRNNGLLERVDGTLGSTAAGARSVDTVPVYVDSFTSNAGQATFILAWDNASEEMSLGIERPNGSEVQPGDAGVEFFYDPASANRYIRVATPEPGFWSVVVGYGGASTLNYSMQVHGAPSEVVVRASASEDTYTYPSPMLVQTTVAAGEAVSGASVTAEVTRPAKSPVMLTLYDDGQSAHGDLRALDGIYSNFFGNYAGDGSYVFNITADGQNAHTAAHVEEGGSFVAEAVDRFVRRTQVTAVLSGAPAAQYDYVYLPLLTYNFSAATGFNSQFNGSAAGWQPRAGSWYVDSNFYYTYGLAGMTASASYAATYADLDYEAAMWRSGCDSCANRLYVRGTVEPMTDANIWHEYYVFQYTRDGYFSVWKRVGDVSYEVYPWTQSSVVNQGDAWNTLHVMATGSTFYFSINDTLVWAGSDPSLYTGQVGLGMYRLPDSTGDQLWVDWATLTSLSTVQLDAANDKAQALDDAVSGQRGGDENRSPSARP